MRHSFPLCLCLLLFAGRALAAPTALGRLADSMSGTFSTAEQAHGNINFHHLTLHVIPIWTDRTDGPWLYSEQALADVPDHPYRQRIYQLAVRADGTLEVRTYEIPDPVAATGAWKNPSLLAKLSPADLSAQEGCTVLLRTRPDGSFQGGTEGKLCSNTQDGAAYATNEVTISESQTIMWERGYNASDVQVWGSIHGGYIFKKQ